MASEAWPQMRSSFTLFSLLSSATRLQQGAAANHATAPHRLGSGTRCRHYTRIRPHEPVRVQVLGSVLAIERPRRRVLWIHIDANASRLTAREPCHERSP